MSLAACSTLQVHSDHDARADFSKYHTYAWAPEPSGSKATDISGIPSDLMEERIRDAVDADLAAKGLRIVGPADHPDLLVHALLTHADRLQVSDTRLGMGVGYGYWPWYGSVSSPAYYVRQYTEGTLVIDLVDSRTDRLVWRGIASDVAEGPEKSREQINEAVAETLKRYPPSNLETG